ncbi:retropepsin-like aspartic protease family protein [Flavobacterium filum]|uniref:retropepsin-like aspartic protease family protein n=1 Tax=Flavobacterium filum TaxID=370974 RepID=UPI000410D14A|nr:retropepsin-like aspartic protease [Flavobacterium filum]
MKKITILLISIMSFGINYSQKIIEMEKVNGVYEIPCKVNGIPMKFIFDTGASDVAISVTEAKFLYKQGLILDSDFIEKINYKIANGEIVEGTRIILKHIDIGGIILTDVSAVIINKQNSPLLLGQSAIEKIGQYTIDGNKLILKDYEKFDSKEIALKNIITNNITYAKNNLIVKCEFKKNFLGVQTLVSNETINFSKEDLESNELQYKLHENNRILIYSIVENLCSRNGMWVRQLNEFNYNAIVFMMGVYFKENSILNYYTISTKKLLEIYEDINIEKLGSIINVQQIEIK